MKKKEWILLSSSNGIDYSKKIKQEMSIKEFVRLYNSS